MKLDRRALYNTIEIWQPRYRDNTVLINPNKVATHNKVIFTKAKHLDGKEFYISGEKVRACHKESNGRIDCHVVPMGELEPFELEPPADYSDLSKIDIP